ncbi:MAG: SUMF1/EgtB/PvdO family nonheme iron enzyme [Marivibrio sp.]|uniref:formylglycine-generating enzyme family protein n=1 Tax=Marivibrio sp. TaxID=2039719 RepID=UPI0032EAB639
MNALAPPSAPFRGKIRTLFAGAAAAFLLSGLNPANTQETVGVGDSFKDCATCPEMVVVPAGSFVMGRDGGEPEEAPATEVQVTAPFAISRTEITIGQYEACVAAGACLDRWDHQRGWFDERDDRESFPIVSVSYDRFQLYIAWLIGKTGRHYRMPSEAEWEWAASGGRDAARWWGDGPVPSGQVNCLNCPGEDWRGLAPTAQFPANPFGLHDMLGNLSEYVGDCWRDSHEGRPATAAYYGPCDTAFRTLRGGKWSSGEKWINRYTRRRYPGDASSNDFGFRLVTDDLRPADRSAD